MATQTVIVKKSHPKVRSRADAARVAARVTGRKPGTSRETATSYRFRQRPPGDFSSMRTKRINPHVSVVSGPLRRGRKK